MKRIRWSLILLTLIFAFGGCGLSNYSSSTISVDNKGEVTSVLVDDFDSDDYNVDDLNTSVQESVDAFNKANKDEEIELKTCKEDTKKKFVYVKLVYSSANAYTTFNQRDFFCGSIEDAKNSYELPSTFISTSGDETGLDTITSDDTSKEIIVLEEAMKVKTSGDILYVSDNVDIVDDTTAQVKEDEAEGNENGNTGTSQHAFIIYES